MRAIEAVAGPVAGSGYKGPDPPTVPPAERASKVSEPQPIFRPRIVSTYGALRVTFADEAIRGSCTPNDILHKRA
jgi:hypothetical protein